MQHARQADAALADFHHELDDRVRPIDTLRESCANLKDSCANLHTMVTATSSTLASLVALMGNTHERISTLEAATAKNEANVAATTAAHASTAAAVAEIGSVVTDAVDDHVGRHIGSLKSDVSSLGQDVLALRALLATMHGTPTPTATDGTVTPLKPPADFAAPPLEEAQPLDADDTPPPAATGTPRPTNKLFPHVDSTNLRVDVTQHDHFHTRPADPRFPTGGRHDDDAASSDGGQWAPGWQAPSWQQNWSQRAPQPSRSPPANPTRSSPANPYRPSQPHVQGPHPHEPQMFGDADHASLGVAISSPRHLDRRRQAANARVSQFDIAALADVKYHGGGDGYYPLTPAIIHNCGYTAINTVDVISSYNEIILVHESVMTKWVG